MSGSDPTAEARGRLPRTPECPFCGRSETELMNAFGSQLSVSTYWCNRCRSPFELMKWLEPDRSDDRVSGVGERADPKES
jgi:transcription elongation factor Elf1